MSGLPEETGRPPGPWRLFREFFALGAVAFGGPAMVAHIRRLVVERRGWLPEGQFREGVALCQAIPGATAMQCATFCGLRLRGLAGALSAFAGFVLPAFLLMLGLSSAYSRVQDLPAALAVLKGLRWVVLALVAQAAWSFGRQHVAGWLDLAVAAGSALLFHLGVHPLAILGAGVATGWLRGRGAGPAPAGRELPRRPLRETCGPALKVALAGGAALALLAGLDPRLGELALSMIKVDLVAFGGGFAALPLFFREVVQTQGWLDASTFLDGITLGQVTPGPIVITATFIGYQTAGWTGALAATAGVFLPSLVVLLAAEPGFARWNRLPATRLVTRHLVLGFVGLLVSVVLRMAGDLAWSAGGAALALAAFLLLWRKVPVQWVVLGAGLLSIWPGI